jgi:hypothetical protein
MEKADLQASLEMLLMQPKEGAGSKDLPGGMMVETIEMPF